MPVEKFASTGMGRVILLYLDSSGQNPSVEEFYCLPIRVTSVP
jgi:hypothetical protein